MSSDQFADVDLRRDDVILAQSTDFDPLSSAETIDCRFPLRFDPGFPSRTDPALMMVSGSGVRQVPRFLLCGFGGFRRAVLETEAVVSGRTGRACGDVRWPGRRSPWRGASSPCPGPPARTTL